jgi:ABC-2 type transport system permease protein
MWKRITRIIRKEFLQALREPRMRVLLFLPPLVQLLVFGYAVNLDVERSRIAWMDMDRTPASLELLESFTGSGRFEVAAAPSSDQEVQALLDRGQVQAAVCLLPGFARDIAAGRRAPVQILLDGTNSNTASIVAGYAQSVIATYTNRVLAQQQRAGLVARSMATGAAASLPVGTVVARTRVWFNPDLRSRNYFVPGVIINIITIVTLMLTAMAVVREKEIGTMEQLLVTPIRPIELMLGKMLPFALVGLFDLVLVTVAGLLIFGIPFRGSPLVLLAGALLFLLSTLGAGLFLSTISQTQQQAMMAAFFFFMPAFALSGFAFPIRNMPPPVQLLTYLNPVRFFMEIVRNVFLKGTGFAVLWPQMAALLIFGTAILGLAAFRFHKRLD